jgi:hypothetical protein
MKPENESTLAPHIRVLGEGAAQPNLEREVAHADVHRRSGAIIALVVHRDLDAVHVVASVHKEARRAARDRSEVRVVEVFARVVAVLDLRDNESARRLRARVAPASTNRRGRDPADVQRTA